MRKSDLVGRQIYKLKCQAAIKVYTRLRKKRLRTGTKQRNDYIPRWRSEKVSEGEMIDLGLKNKYKFAK